MAHTTTREANFDGLVGPTHNYAGLAFGNVASASNKGAASSPKAAALQGLRKMKALADKGLWQAVLPPQPRPRFDVLRSLGFTGSDGAMLDAAARTAPHLLAAVYSASSMWTANAATISPSADTVDGKLHLKPANLISGFHRHLETAQTTRVLRQIFSNPLHFVVHDAPARSARIADEGAANILRLAPEHGGRGLEIWCMTRRPIATRATPQALSGTPNPARV